MRDARAFVSLSSIATMAVVLSAGCGASTPRRNATPTLATPVASAAGQAAVAVTPQRTITIGHSVRGVPIRATRRGVPGAPHQILVVGVIHGNESAGLAVISRLFHASPPPGTDLWLIRAVNPDGLRAGTRQNARGVDLNHNFPFKWKPYEQPWDPYYSGPRAASEPETRAAMRFILRIQPEVTIWYHQHEHEVIEAPGNIALEAKYARLVGLPFDRHYPFAPGRATYWQHAHVSGSTAFVVEFGAGSLSPRVAVRHARAVLALAKIIATG
jgi:murein peptide amidase A